MARVAVTAALAALGHAAPVAAADRFLPAEDAFRLQARLVAPDRAELLFDIAPGYYLYRAPLAVQAEGARVGALELPAGIVQYDENFQKEVETYRERLQVGVPLSAVSGPVTLVVQSQGCAEAGLCYPLGTTRIRLGGVGAFAMASTPASPPAGALASAGQGPATGSAGAAADAPQGQSMARWASAGAGAGVLALVAVLWWRRRRR